MTEQTKQTIEKVKALPGNQGLWLTSGRTSPRLRTSGLTTDDLIQLVEYVERAEAARGQRIRQKVNQSVSVAII